MGAIWYYRFRKFGGFVMIVGFISAGFNPPHSLTLEELNFLRNKTKVGSFFSFISLKPYFFIFSLA